MKVTTLLLLVVDAIHKLCAQERPVTAQSVAGDLGVEWNLKRLLLTLAHIPVIYISSATQAKSF